VRRPSWLLVFVAAFCLYALTTAQRPQGYEPETSAVAEGLIRTGDFVVLPDTVLKGVAQPSGIRSDNGKQIGRAGLPSVLVKVPFYAAGRAIDSVAGGQTWQVRMFWFALPAVAALGAVFFFLAAFKLTGSSGWALALTGMFAAGSLSWAYSKAGMETVLTTGALLTFAAVLHAQAGSSWKPWVAAGFGAGMVIADKPYGLLAIAAMLALLVKPWREASPAERRRYLLALAVPLVLWAAAMAGYNLTRTGSMLDTGRNEPGFTLAFPFNAAGFLVSPGKGLVWYSPLVIIGLLGLWRLWPRREAKAILAAIAAAVLVASVLPFWSDETWGPRYIAWVAWLPLLAIPWARVSKRLVVAVAVVAVSIQIVSVIAPAAWIVNATEDLTGEPIFQRTPGERLSTPFGRDPIRWIPELSPLVLQTKLVASKASVAVGGPPVTTLYRPYEGPRKEVRLDAAKMEQYGFATVNFWWAQPGAGAFAWAALLLALCGGSAVVLLARSVRRPPAEARPSRFRSRFSRSRPPAPEPDPAHGSRPAS
jgi:hypothetical protein